MDGSIDYPLWTQGEAEDDRIEDENFFVHLSKVIKKYRSAIRMID